jgi:hypothetical protein
MSRAFEGHRFSYCDSFLIPVGQGEDAFRRPLHLGHYSCQTMRSDSADHIRSASAASDSKLINKLSKIMNDF